MDLIEEFRKKYPDVLASDIHTAYSPYRVCPLGAHIDHQYGMVTGFALDKGVTLCFTPTNNDQIEMDSLNFPGHIAFNLDAIEAKVGNWGDYLRGAVFSLVQNRYPVSKGLRGIIQGTIPIGGLSSSAAVILCYIKALAFTNGFSIEGQRLVEIALYAENAYVGLNNGKLDQSCEVLCKKDQLLFLDTRDNTYTTIPSTLGMRDYEIAVFYSGVSRNLGKGYNMRVDEAKSAAYCLQAFSGRQYGVYKDTRLRDVPYEVYKVYGDSLPAPFKKRAMHYYGEMDRVRQGIKAWEKGDIIQFGNLMFESGYSSIHYWETGSPELIAIYDIMKKTEGIYGGRFSGAGFKGCCMAMINPAYEESIKESVTAEYLKRFPQYKEVFEVHFCKTADGVKVS